MTAVRPTTRPVPDVADEHKKGVADFFANSADYWKDIYSQDKPEDYFDHYTVVTRQESVIRMISTHVGVKNGIVLEAGCGAGQLLKKIAACGFAVVGMDLAFPMARLTYQHLYQSNDFIGCIVADVEHIPFKSGTFAAIASVGVMQYLHSDTACIAEFCRVTHSNGGRIIITLPNFFRIFNFFDPVYIIRLIEFFVSRFHGMTHKASRRFTKYDYTANRVFASRRYHLGQLDGIFSTHKYELLGTAAVGYGPFTFLKRQVFSASLSIKLSNLLQTASQKKVLKWLLFFGNRWVYCYGSST